MLLGGVTGLVATARLHTSDCYLKMDSWVQPRTSRSVCMRPINNLFLLPCRTLILFHSLLVPDSLTRLQAWYYFGSSNNNGFGKPSLEGFIKKVQNLATSSVLSMQT